MKPNRVRPLALAVILDAGRIFVAEGRDEITDQTFYRPLGGKIELGERSAATVARELREEIGAELTDLHYLGTLENIFTYNGRQGHEIVLLHRAAFVDRGFYTRESVAALEDDGALNFVARWVALDEFRRGRFPLYPDGLLALLEQHGLA